MKIEDFEKGAWFTLPFGKSNTTANTLYFGLKQEGTGLVKYLDNERQFDYVRPEDCIQGGFGEVPSRQWSDKSPTLEEHVRPTCAPATFSEVFGQKPVIPSQFEVQVGGDHYAKRGIQPLEYILANKLDFCQGNVVKYVTRFRDKNGAEDLKKVIHYAMFLLEDEYQIRSKVEYSDG